MMDMSDHKLLQRGPEVPCRVFTELFCRPPPMEGVWTPPRGPGELVWLRLAPFGSVPSL